MRQGASGRGVAVLIVVGFASGAPSALALDPRKALTQYSRDQWQTEQGLPQLSVQAIVQTRDGYLWLGTQEGLVRFDGVRFTVFNKMNTPALRSNFIQALWEGDDGSLWIGTGGGALTRLLRGRFTTYAAAQGLTSEVLWAVYQDRAGRVWVGSGGGGLYLLRGERFVAHTTRDGLASDTVFAIAEDRQGTLWIGTDGGLNRMRDGHLTSLPAGQALPSPSIYAVYPDPGGGLWLGTGKGLVRLEDGRLGPVYTARQGLSADRVNTVLRDGDGNLWIGTEGGGLDRLHAGTLARYRPGEHLAGETIKALYEDREGSLWVGTRAQGLSRLKDGAFTTYSTEEGLSNDVTWSVLEDRQGSLWIATDHGLSRFQDGRFSVYTKKDGLSFDMVRSLLEDRSGGLWIGTWGGGLNRLAGGRFSALTRAQGLAHDQVRALLEDRQGALWIGTYGGGLSRLKDGRFTTYTAREGLGNDTVYCLHEDRSGDLWIGTRGGGLTRLREGRFTTYTARDGLPDPVVLSIYEDAQAALWIGTTGGLARLKHGRFAGATSRQGLYDDVVYQMLEDARGNLWMSSNTGISRVPKRELEDLFEGRRAAVTAVGYGKADGMKTSECDGGVQPAGWKSRDGRLWFPTARGVVMVDPENLARNTQPPPVVIERAVVDGRSLPPDQPLRAPPGRGELQFHYAGLSFRAPERVRFKYRLEGFDEGWVDAGARREAYYTNIPPGRYAFRVIACNDDGLWNDSGAELRLELRPHLYETRLFRSLAGLAVLLAGLGLYGLRVRSLKARERELVVVVEKRTRDLREAIRLKDEVLSIMAHDFRSPLTLIQGYAEMLLGQARGGEAGRLLGIIVQQAHHLASLAANTLTVSRIETGVFPLSLEDVKLGELMPSVVAARGDDSRVQLAIEASAQETVVRGDANRLHEVVENLVANALKYSPEGAEVMVTLRRTPEGAQVSVADHGPGIPVQEMPNLFQKFGRLPDARRRRIPGQGLGLYICRSIVQAHGGRIWAESQPGQGATFHFVLPLAGPEPAPAQ